MLNQNRRGNVLIQCVVGMAILLCFILMISTFNLMSVKNLRKNQEFERISDYIDNFKKEIKMEKSILNSAALGDTFYLNKEDLDLIHIKDIKEIIKGARVQDSILIIQVIEEGEFTNKIRISTLEEKVEVKEYSYVWKEKKRTDAHRSYMFLCNYWDNKHRDMQRVYANYKGKFNDRNPYEG